MTSAEESFTIQNCEGHNSAGDFWVVVDSYVLDISNFIDHHPGSLQKIINKRKQLGVDISPNFLDHFGRTVATFRKACEKFDRIQKKTSFRFTDVPNVDVIILGKLK